MALQIRYNESIYWNIVKGAERFDLAKLKHSKGPLDEFTHAEKVATELFMVEAGFGTSRENKHARVTA